MKQKGVNVKGGMRNGREYGMANFAVESQGFVVLAAWGLTIVTQVAMLLQQMNVTYKLNHDPCHMICGMCTLLLSIIESFSGFCLPKLNQCRLLTNNECTLTDDSTTNMHIDI